MAQSTISTEIKAGIVVSDVGGDALSALNSLIVVANGTISRQPLTGYSVGLAANIPLGGFLTLQPGLQYTQTGAMLRGDLGLKGLEFLGAGASARLMQNKIELPVLLKAKVTQGLEVVAGLNGAYAFDNRLRLRAGVLGFNLVNQKVPLNNALFEPLQLSAMAGLQYTTEKGIGFYAHYDHGLSRLMQNGMANIFGRSFSAGVRFGF